MVEIALKTKRNLMQSWEMSNLLHRAKSSYQILPRIIRNNFGTFREQNLLKGLFLRTNVDSSTKLDNFYMEFLHDFTKFHILPSLPHLQTFFIQINLSNP